MTLGDHDDRASTKRILEGVAASVIAALILGGGGLALKKMSQPSRAISESSSQSASNSSTAITKNTAGTLVKPKTTPPSKTPSHSAQPSSHTARTVASTTAALDPTGDADQAPDNDGETFGPPADISRLTLSATPDDLTITLTFSPTVDMKKATAQLDVRLSTSDSTCQNQVLTGADFAIDLGEGSEQRVLSLPDDCTFHEISKLPSRTNGHTVATTVPLDLLGLTSGQQIVVRCCSQTMIDSSSWTEIQDYIPNSSSGLKFAA